MISSRPSNKRTVVPAGKPKSKSKKADADIPKPKRPLSAFNLFYRYKRDKIVALGIADKESMINLVKTPPGLERYPPNSHVGSPVDAVNSLRGANIREEMEGNLLPRDTRSRSHRVNSKAINGAMPFLELGKLMNTSWQECDEFAKDVFRDLAEIGREVYKVRLKEYNAKVNEDSKEKKDDEAKEVTPAKADRANAAASSPRSPFNQAAYNREYPPSAMAAAALRGVPTLPPLSPTQVSPGAASEGMLLRRVRELESQLAAARLRSRVVELESSLARQRATEAGLRAQLNLLARPGGMMVPPMGMGMGMGGAMSAPPMMPITPRMVPPSAPGTMPPGARPASADARLPHGEDGLWSLVSASMMHPHSPGRSGGDESKSSKAVIVPEKKEAKVVAPEKKEEVGRAEKKEVVNAPEKKETAPKKKGTKREAEKEDKEKAKPSKRASTTSKKTKKRASGESPASKKKKRRVKKE